MNTWLSLRAVMCAAAVLIVATATAVSAPPDRKAPTRPTSLRVTATTPWSISLAWNASTDNSGQFSYLVVCSNGQGVVLPKTATSVTFTQGLQHKGTYSFYVMAVDAAGNQSQKSNSVSVTLPEDTTAPTAPAITLTDAGPTHIVVSLAAIDNGSPLIYRLYMNGQPIDQASSTTSRTMYLLQPETTYAFTAEARDSAGNWSPMSEPLLVTTEAADPNDTTPPTTPTNLGPGTYSDGSTEFTLSWTASTDDVTPQEYIRYDLYVNGLRLNVTVGRTHLNEYGEIGENVIELIAVDAGGNESEPATVIMHLP